jgi:hypothetical protein
VTVDATDPIGPVDLVAQGLLFGVDNTTVQSVVDALHPTNWRVSGTGETYDVARASGATITDVLSNLWYDTQGPVAPWSNWARYAAWLRQVVTTAVQTGETPNYWEIQNEPDGWYGSIPPETTHQALYQYQLGATIIRSIDPTAKIEGPSLLGYFQQPGAPTLGMADFLSFVAKNNLPLDAVSWHEVIGTAVNQNPNVVIANVAAVRAELKQYPRLAHIPIFINEYSSNATHLIPGWAVGWISALEQAGVAEATRACWHQPDLSGKEMAECNEGGLDGLLQPGSGLPEDLYWVHWAYGQMAGQRIYSSSTDPNLSAYATYNALTGEIQILLGRHASCTAAVRVDCTEPASATPPPERVVVLVKTPAGWAAVDTSVLRIANTPGPMFPSYLGDQTLPVPTSGGFADGDAYALTVTNW